MIPDPGSAEAKRERRQAILISLLLAATIIGCFWPVTRNQFINMDDLDYITQNPHVQAGLTWSTIKWAFTTFHAGNWHPITWLSHAFDCQLFNLNPAGHHFISALLHAINTVLLFLFLRSMTAATWRSAFVAALFGLHPMHVESVAWAAERKDVLSAFFFILTLWAYACYVRRKSINHRWTQMDTDEGQKGTLKGGHRTTFPPSVFYLSALLLFVCGLMSKPMLVTVPFVLLLLDYWPLSRLQLTTHNSRLTTCLAEKIPFFALSAGAGILTIIAQKKSDYIASAQAVPFDARVLNALISYATYVKKFFWPVDLAVYYPYRTNIPAELGFAAAFLLLLISIGAFALWRRRPYLLMGWLWFLGTLIPVIGLLQVGLQSMADRYSYIPSIGLFIAISWAATDMLKAAAVRPVKLPKSSPSPQPSPPGEGAALRTLVAAAGAACLIVLAFLTCQQLGYWKNNETLYRHTLRIVPDNPLIIGNLGSALVEAGRYKEAVEYLEEALKRKPGFAEAQLSWGVALWLQGRVDEAIPHYRRAIELNPGAERPHYLLANALTAQGKRPEAAQEYEIALQMNPHSPYAANDFAWILATAPDPNLRNGLRAVALGETACQLTKYSDPLFIGTLAAAYAESGQFEKAVQTATLAEEKARAVKDDSLAKKNAELRELYQKRQPYHEDQK